MKTRPFLANCALVLCAVIWGMNFIFQKQASMHLGAFTFISLRYYLGVLSLLPLFFYMRRRKGSRRSGGRRGGGAVARRRFWLAALGASLANWGGAVLVQIGLHVADATKAGFIESAYIALVPVLDLLLFRKKTSRRVWIGIAMAIVGLYLLCISDGFSLDVNDAAIMASTLCFALHILLWSRFSPHVDALPFMVVEFLCTGTLSGLVALFTESLTLADLTAAVAPLLFAGVLGVGVTYIHQIYAQRFTPASVAALLMSMEAVFSAVGGVIILHEMLSVREWGGLRHHAADHLLCPTTPSGACQAGACQGRMKPHTRPGTPQVSRRFLQRDFFTEEPDFPHILQAIWISSRRPKRPFSRSRSRRAS